MIIKLLFDFVIVGVALALGLMSFLGTLFVFAWVVSNLFGFH
jgi:hypothetical protein